MRKSIWIQIVALLLIVGLVGCSAPIPPSTVPSKTNTSTHVPTISEALETQTEPKTAADVNNDDSTNSDEFKLNEAQRNAIAMLYHLATTTEEIRISKDNRVILEDIYTSLLNEINPGAIDETTQDHLVNIRKVIGEFLNIQSKREQLQYIHNQQKAAAMKEAVPDPLAILSLTKSLNWKKLAINAVFTVVDSYNNYKSASDNADKEFILSGWELDDKEKEVIRKNRDSSFDYMTDIVQQYGSNEDKKALGKLTLNEKAITDFAEMCAIDEVFRKIERLTNKEDTYKLFGNYWLELANCYFEIEDYKKCLECVQKYNDLGIDIFRQDFNIVPVLPKAIVSAQEEYTGEEYISNVKNFADLIEENANDRDWSVRYFAAQTYMDLYAKTNDRTHLEKAYEIVKDNIILLIDGQKELNEAYLGNIEKTTLDEKQAKKLTDKEKKAEQKRIDAYNDSLEEKRKTELPPLYEPLILNCDLLFALAEKLQLEQSEQIKITNILQTETNGVFLSEAVNNKYRFNSVEKDYNVDLSKEKIIIPANLLTQGAKITVTVVDGKDTTTFDDFKIKEVERNEKAKGKKDEVENAKTFKAQYTSKEMSGYKWSSNAKIKIEISNGDTFEPLVLNYKVKKHKGNWIFPDSVTFEKA